MHRVAMDQRNRLALQVNRAGEVADMPARIATAMMPPGLWRVAHPTRSEDGKAELVRALVDAPFYTRSEIRTRLLGRMPLQCMKAWP
jgi:hypothetical protein